MRSEQFMELTVLPGTNRCGRRGVRPDHPLPGRYSLDCRVDRLGQIGLCQRYRGTRPGRYYHRRSILINGLPPSDEMVRDPAKKPIALITQNTRVIADLTVQRFLALHIKARDTDALELVARTVMLANEFTGEKITESMRMTSLSGGQTRSLLIADAILIGQTPILLLDEVENAGIFKEKVIRCLKHYHKAVIFVTHDPLLAMITDRRIIMKNGAVTSVIEPDGAEKEMVLHISGIDAFLIDLRERIRAVDLIKSEQLPRKDHLAPVQ